MCDEFEDVDDELLLNIVCSPPEENVSPAKRLSETSNESDLVKRPKLDDCNELSPPLFNDANTQNSHKNAQYCAKRLFPGPAGIFSDTNVTLNSQIPVCSQNTSVIFQEGPWQEVSKDFRISDSLCLQDKFNIAWLKKEAVTNQFASQKAPFLAAMLMSLDVSDIQLQKYVNITLKDSTGSIQGNILHSLYEEYASHFTLGSILILVQFGILSCTCDKCDNHHLTITPKNLSAIYSGAKKIVIRTVRPQDVLDDFYHRKQKELHVKNQMSDMMELTSKSVISSSRKNFNLNNKHSPSNRSQFQNEHLKNPLFCVNNKNRRPTTVEISSANKSNNMYPVLLKKLNSQESEGPNCEINNDKGNKHSNNGRKLFTFKKISVSKVSIDNSLLNLPHQSNTQMECSGNNIKLAGSQVSVRIDNKEHEKLWKDALDDVDINSLFDDF